jgi:transcriptional regulator with XRE-family HTH domain
MANSKVQKNAIDWYIVNKVREIRTDRGFSQQDIADHLGTSASFIGQIESPGSRAKYKTLHLNELAKLLGCSTKDFWPEKAI